MIITDTERLTIALALLDDRQYIAYHKKCIEQEHDYEHNPDICGCEYRGNGMWSCGHIDNNPD